MGGGGARQTEKADGREKKRVREKTSSERTTDDVDGTVWPEGAWTPYLFKFGVYIIDVRVRWI